MPFTYNVFIKYYEENGLEFPKNHLLQFLNILLITLIKNIHHQVLLNIVIKIIQIKNIDI